jgi:hypothetical protein
MVRSRWPRGRTSESTITALLHVMACLYVLACAGTRAPASQGGARCDGRLTTRPARGGVGTATLEVTIVDSATRSPITCAWVLLAPGRDSSLADSGWWAGLTDSSGRLTADSLRSGPWVLTVRRLAYLPADSAIDLGSGSDTAVVALLRNPKVQQLQH